MRYVGGKTRIANWVAEHVLASKGACSVYVEPFVGSGAVFAKCAPHFETIVAADAHPDLILLWKAIANGWKPPESVSREDYYSLKIAEPSALRGFVGFGSSFGGKWFGGYTDQSFKADGKTFNGRPFAKAASDACLKMAPILRQANIEHMDYAEHEADSYTLFYCDPPYANTVGYKGAGIFDSERFWKIAEYWHRSGATVIVSEETAPAGWKVLAQRNRKAFLRVCRGEENETRSEFLFVHE